MTTTLGELTSRHGFGVLEHLEAEAQVPVHNGLQAQGDLLIIPSQNGLVPASLLAKAGFTEVPPEGIAVIEAAGGGHEHRLFAGTPGTAWWKPSGPGQDIGVLDVTEAAYLLHPEHGATGIAPGSYMLRRQRELADEERLVED